MPNMSNDTSVKQPMFILIMLVIFSPMAIDIYLPALPLIAQEFSVNHSLAQDTVTWFIFSLGLGQLFAGPLADRYGRKPIAVMGVIIYTVCSGAAFVAKNIDLLLISRLFQGLGACATSVAAFACVRDSFGPEKSGRMISYLNGAICCIPALAPIFGSWLTSEFGWRSNFSFMLFFGLFGLILLCLFMKETRPENTKVSDRLLSWTSYKIILCHPTFLFHSLMCLVAMAVILAYVTSAPVYLMGNLKLTMAQFAQWFGINALFNISASLLAPKLMDRIGSYNALVIGVAVLAMSGIMMLVLQPWVSAWAFMVPVICSSIGFAFVLGAGAGKALSPFGDRAGTAAALLGVIQMSGAGLLIALIQRTSLNDIHVLSLTMLLLIPALIILLTNTGKKWHHNNT